MSLSVLKAFSVLNGFNKSASSGEFDESVSGPMSGGGQPQASAEGAPGQGEYDDVPPDGEGQPEEGLYPEDEGNVDPGMEGEPVYDNGGQQDIVAYAASVGTEAAQQILSDPEAIQASMSNPAARDIVCQAAGEIAGKITEAIIRNGHIIQQQQMPMPEVSPQPEAPEPGQYEDLGYDPNNLPSSEDVSAAGGGGGSPEDTVAQQIVPNN